MYDDLGLRLTGSGPRRRVVSLVPSLTESVATVAPEALIGATDWCSHPAGLDVIRVRGTKNPDVAAIIALGPDLVLANKEENRRRDVETLRAAGIPVWVTVIETVEQALTSLQRMFAHALEWPEPDWLSDAVTRWATLTRSAPRDALQVAVPIWRDPWMVVGRDTFSGDLLARLGILNVFADSMDRYPHVDVDLIRSAGADVILFPDEPYRFTASDGPELFSGTRFALIEGRALTWYGPSLLTAPDVVMAAVA